MYILSAVFCRTTLLGIGLIFMPSVPAMTEFARAGQIVEVPAAAIGKGFREIHIGFVLKAIEKKELNNRVTYIAEYVSDQANSEKKMMIEAHYDSIDGTEPSPRFRNLARKYAAQSSTNQS